MPKPNSIDFFSKDKDRNFIDKITSKLDKLSSDLEPKPRESKFRRYQHVEPQHKPEHLTSVPLPAYHYYTHSTPALPSYPLYEPYDDRKRHEYPDYGSEYANKSNFGYCSRSQFSPRSYCSEDAEYSSGQAVARALSPPSISVPPSSRMVTRVVRESRGHDDLIKPRLSDQYGAMLAQITSVDSRIADREGNRDVLRAELAAYRRLADWYCQRGGRKMLALRDEEPLDVRYYSGKRDLEALEDLVGKTFGRKWWEDGGHVRPSPTVADSIMEYCTQQD